MLKYCTYVLRSKIDNNLYIGSTNDLKKRIKEHNSGKNLSTKYRKPFELVYYEIFSTLKEARKREILFKKSHSIMYKAAHWKDNHK